MNLERDASVPYHMLSAVPLLRKGRDMIVNFPMLAERAREFICEDGDYDSLPDILSLLCGQLDDDLHDRFSDMEADAAAVFAYLLAMHQDEPHGCVAETAEILEGYIAALQELTDEYVLASKELPALLADARRRLDSEALNTGIWTVPEAAVSRLMGEMFEELKQFLERNAVL